MAAFLKSNRLRSVAPASCHLAYPVSAATSAANGAGMMAVAVGAAAAAAAAVAVHELYRWQ